MTLHVALICPQIPPNTGNIARLCVGADVPLHLIEPLGFRLDEAAVKRAGIDHWEKVDLWVRCTAGLSRRGGAWKITHQHTSVPFLMDGSFKAAVDLKP